MPTCFGLILGFGYSDSELSIKFFGLCLLQGKCRRNTIVHLQRQYNCFAANRLLSRAYDHRDWINFNVALGLCLLKLLIRHQLIYPGQKVKEGSGLKPQKLRSAV